MTEPGADGPPGWRDAVRAAAALLADSSDTARLDAELLAAHVLGVEREAMLLGQADGRRFDAAGFNALITRRRAHEPVAYITGMRDFWTLRLHVGPGVLIPRPDSETVIEAAIRRFGVEGPRRVLDLGTGSGALLLACLAQWEGATGIGVDQSSDALDYCRLNAAENGLVRRATFRQGNWCDGIDDKFDLIVANPPYVETDADLPPDVRLYEPATALFAGADGLDDYRRLIPQLPARLAPGGATFIEIGHRQADAVAAIGRMSGLDAIVHRDLAGRDRVVELFSCNAM